MAYKLLAKSKKKSHQNKRFYDKRDRTRNFEVNDPVYLYTRHKARLEKNI